MCWDDFLKFCTILISGGLIRVPRLGHELRFKVILFTFEPIMIRRLAYSVKPLSSTVLMVFKYLHTNFNIVTRDTNTTNSMIQVDNSNEPRFLSTKKRRPSLIFTVIANCDCEFRSRLYVSNSPVLHFSNLLEAFERAAVVRFKSIFLTGLSFAIICNDSHSHMNRLVPNRNSYFDLVDRKLHSHSSDNSLAVSAVWYRKNRFGVVCVSLLSLCDNVQDNIHGRIIWQHNSFNCPEHVPDCENVIKITAQALVTLSPNL
ncbi:hypothetical protein BC833DRAFT_564143 [Globomyces pollinis-pini]|nr:hypothetical protein BC833DRAFT_564143 [Globomyces pollinis-pini]